MYGLGKGGGGGGHGGGGHGGGGHHGGGGGHHGGGGGGHHHHGGGRGGSTVIVQGGGYGYGPGWWGDASYPYPVVVEPTCEVMDQAGRCAIFDANGKIIGFQGLGDDAAQMGSATSWVTGGIIIGLAVVMFAVDSKNPLGFKNK